MTVKKTPEKPRRVGDGTPGPGRPKGVPNKFTGALKDMVREALDRAGGVEYLLTQAEDDPKTFLALVGRLIPQEASLHHEGHVTWESLIVASLEPK